MELLWGSQRGPWSASILKARLEQFQPIEQFQSVHPCNFLPLSLSLSPTDFLGERSVLKVNAMTMASCGKLVVLNQLFNSLDDAFKQHLIENSNALFRLLNIDSADMFVKFMTSVFVDEFYDPQKHVFTFGEHSMGVTLEDVLFLTGLPIIGKPVVLSNSNDGSAFLRVFGERFKGKMSLSFPEALEIATNVDEEINRRKIAVLLIICSAFISPNNDKHIIPSSYVQFLENVDDVDTYAWGAALLSYLYCGAKSYMTKKKGRGNLWIVLAFFLIRLPKLQKLMGVDLSDHSEAVRDGAPWLPWIVQQIKKKSHNHYLNYKIDLILPLDDEDIKWTPYANMVCPRDQDHLNAARDITPLFCYNYVEHHMPHNCSQQFPVFKSYNLGSMSWNYYEIKFKHRKGGHVQNFLEFYKNEINAYNNRKPAELYMTATESEGSFEHDGVDHGTEHNSEHNEDLSGHHDFFVHENERERLVHDASTQLLSRKRNTGSSKKTKGADDEPVLSDGLLTGCCRTAKESKPTNESVKFSVSSSSKSNKRKLTTGCTTEQEETTVVIEGNHLDESNIEIVKESNKGKSSTGCTKVQEEVAVVSENNHPDESNVEIKKEGFGNTTEKQLEADDCAVASKAKCQADIINIDDDIFDDTALELLHSGLQARTSRLEKIIVAYKAAKFGSKF